jgi:hypothetical protein
VLHVGGPDEIGAGSIVFVCCIWDSWDAAANLCPKRTILLRAIAAPAVQHACMRDATSANHDEDGAGCSL